MSVTVNIHKCSEGATQVWRIWRKGKRRLACAVVSVHFNDPRHVMSNEETRWKEMQQIALTRLMGIFERAVLVAYGKESIQELMAFGLHPVRYKSSAAFLWTGWLPSLSQSRCFELIESSALRNVINSSAWVEYSGGFVLFTNQSDEDLVSRFVKQSWRSDDQFAAIATVSDNPDWIVVSNHLTQEELIALLEKVFSERVTAQPDPPN